MQATPRKTTVTLTSWLCLIAFCGSTEGANTVELDSRLSCGIGYQLVLSNETAVCYRPPSVTYKPPIKCTLSTGNLLKAQVEIDVIGLEDRCRFIENDKDTNENDSAKNGEGSAPQPVGERLLCQQSFTLEIRRGPDRCMRGTAQSTEKPTVLQQAQSTHSND